MGDVTIPRIMTEKPRCRKPPFYGQNVVKPRSAESSSGNSCMRLLLFTKESQNKRIHRFSRSQARVPWDHASSSRHRCMRTVCDQHVIRDLQERNMFYVGLMIERLARMIRRKR